MLSQQPNPLDFEEGRRKIFKKLVKETEKVRDRVAETIQDPDQRQKGFIACTRLINCYRSAISDWSQASQRDLNVAETLFEEMQESLFSG